MAERTSFGASAQTLSDTPYTADATATVDDTSDASSGNGASVVSLADAQTPQYQGHRAATRRDRARRPRRCAGQPVGDRRRSFVEVDDVDAHHAPRGRGGRDRDPARSRTSEGVGFRLYTAEDLEGHRWMFGQPLAPADA